MPKNLNLTPDIFEKALEATGDIDPDQAMIIGDTIYDVEAAAKANVKAIGLFCGGSMEGQLRQAGCAAIYRDPANLLARYDDSPLARNR